MMNVLPTRFLPGFGSFWLGHSAGLLGGELQAVVVAGVRLRSCD